MAGALGQVGRGRVSWHEPAGGKSRAAERLGRSCDTLVVGESEANGEELRVIHWLSLPPAPQECGASLVTHSVLATGDRRHES